MPATHPPAPTTVAAATLHFIAGLLYTFYFAVIALLWSSHLLTYDPSTYDLLLSALTFLVGAGITIVLGVALLRRAKWAYAWLVGGYSVLAAIGLVALATTRPFDGWIAFAAAVPTTVLVLLLQPGTRADVAGRAPSGYPGVQQPIVHALARRTPSRGPRTLAAAVHVSFALLVVVALGSIVVFARTCNVCDSLDQQVADQSASEAGRGLILWLIVAVPSAIGMFRGRVWAYWSCALLDVGWAIVALYAATAVESGNLFWLVVGLVGIANAALLARPLPDRGDARDGCDDRSTAE